jgi:hypothetical protein
MTIPNAELPYAGSRPIDLEVKYKDGLKLSGLYFLPYCLRFRNIKAIQHRDCPSSSNNFKPFPLSIPLAITALILLNFHFRKKVIKRMNTMFGNSSS